MPPATGTGGQRTTDEAASPSGVTRSATWTPASLGCASTRSRCEPPRPRAAMRMRSVSWGGSVAPYRSDTDRARRARCADNAWTRPSRGRKGGKTTQKKKEEGGGGGGGVGGGVY